jgi:hypothetical protein
MATNKMDIIELTLEDKMSIQGGNPIIWFIAGAIAGGVVYDVVKKVWVTYAKEYIEFSEKTGGEYVIHHAQ